MENRSIRELIRKRKSIRTYQETVLPPETILKLKELISNINKTGPFHNTIRYELIVLDDTGIQNLNKLINYGFIKGAPAFIAGIIKENENNLPDFGYLMEDLILKCVAIEIDTCWLGGSLNTEAFKDKLNIQEGEILPAIFSIGIDAKKTRQFDNVIRSSLAGNKRKNGSALFFSDLKQTPLDQDKIGLYKEVLEMVRIAPSACNKQPWRIVKEQDSDIFHFYLVRDQMYSKSLKFRKKSDLQKMDIGIAMFHFEATANELGLKGQWKFLSERKEIKKNNFEYIISRVK